MLLYGFKAVSMVTLRYILAQGKNTVDSTNGNFVVEKRFMKFSKGCISHEPTLHQPRKVICYNFLAS